MMNILTLTWVSMDLEISHNGMKVVVNGFSVEVIFELTKEICHKT